MPKTNREWQQNNEIDPFIHEKLQQIGWLQLPKLTKIDYSDV